LNGFYIVYFRHYTEYFVQENNPKIYCVNNAGRAGYIIYRH